MTLCAARQTYASYGASGPRPARTPVPGRPPAPGRLAGTILADAVLGRGRPGRGRQKQGDRRCRQRRFTNLAQKFAPCCIFRSCVPCVLIVGHRNPFPGAQRQPAWMRCRVTRATSLAFSTFQSKIRAELHAVTPATRNRRARPQAPGDGAGGHEGLVYRFESGGAQFPVPRSTIVSSASIWRTNAGGRGVPAAGECWRCRRIASPQQRPLNGMARTPSPRGRPGAQTTRRRVFAWPTQKPLQMRATTLKPAGRIRARRLLRVASLTAACAPGYRLARWQAQPYPQPSQARVPRWSWLRELRQPSRQTWKGKWGGSITTVRRPSR